MQRIILSGFLAGVVLTSMPPLSAEETAAICPICHRANNQAAAYPEKAGMTLARGAMNSVFGWTELLVQPTNELQAGGHLLVGIGKGVGFAVKRTAFGVGELLTFWIPKGQHGYLQLNNDCPVCMGRQPRPPSTPRKSLDKRS